LKLAQVVALVAATTGCNPPPPAAPSEPARPICGWEAVDRQAQALRLRGDGTQVAPASTVAVIDPLPDLPFVEVRRALEPAADTLVRIKLVVQERWLLSLTSLRRGTVDPARKPKPSEAVVSVVGHRRVTRRAGAPTMRIGDLRLDGERVELFVENDRAAGRRIPLARLGATLDAIEPPVEVFALEVSDRTPSRHLVTALVAAACHDRGPGDEPHEVLVDMRRSVLQP
jgi:hypothetical protein